MRRLKGSYTIEAVYVMAVVFWTLAAIIQYGYKIHDQTKAFMVLQKTLEQEHQVSDEDTVSGRVKVRGKSLEIQIKPFHPEDFMRKSTLLEILEERKDGD